MPNCSTSRLLSHAGRAGPAEAAARPARVDALKEGAARRHLAEQLVQNGETDQAVKNLTDWLDAHPDDSETRNFLAELCVNTGRLAEARAHYLLLAAQDPKNPVYQNNLAWVLARLGNWQEALPYAKSAATLRPGSVEFLDTLGAILLQTGKPKEALGPLKSAWNKAADRPDIGYHYSQALAAAGRKEEALSVLRRVLNDGDANLRRTRSGAIAVAEAWRLRVQPMCGIAGLWEQRRRTAPDALAAVAAAMTDTLVHRGPDAGDVWLDPEAGLALGHRRLSIIDLSPAGAQPMVSSCGRFVISYNGEVYNADELRSDLEAAGRRFRGHQRHRGDRRGSRGLGRRSDRQTSDRHVRDGALGPPRPGALPRARPARHQAALLGRFDGRLLFGSELKALRADRSWAPELDRDALLPFCASAMCRRPTRSIAAFANCRPGRSCAHRPAARRSIAPYWSLPDVARPGQSARSRGDEEEATSARRAAARRGGPAHGRRRAARRFSVGRHRFIDRRRADAGAERAAGAHLLDRLSRGRVQRGASTPPLSPAISAPNIPSCTSSRATRST